MAAIPYVDNIPLGTDKPRDSQPDLNTNTQGIKTFLETDHVPFANVEAGKHDKVSLPRRADPTAAASELVVYSKVGPLSASTELFFTRDGTATPFNMTESGINSPGWSMVSSGLLMKWGTASANGQASFQDTIGAGPGPGFSFIAFVQLTVLNAAAGDLNLAVRVRSFVAGSPSTINVFAGERTNLNTPINVQFYWLMFGSRA